MPPKTIRYYHRSADAAGLSGSRASTGLIGRLVSHHVPCWKLDSKPYACWTLEPTCFVHIPIQLARHSPPKTAKPPVWFIEFVSTCYFSAELWSGDLRCCRITVLSSGQ